MTNFLTGTCELRPGLYDRIRYFIENTGSTHESKFRMYHTAKDRDQALAGFLSGARWTHRPENDEEQGLPHPSGWGMSDYENFKYDKEEEPMSEFKAGARVKVEFEGEVTFDHSSVRGNMKVKSGDEFAWVKPERVTKLAPALPTKLGAVIESRGYRFMLTKGGWRADVDQDWLWNDNTSFSSTDYAKNFTVLLEGKD